MTTPLRQKDTGVLLPKGAAITGRIVQIQRLYGPGFESLALAVKLETVEVNGAPQPFYARLESAVSTRKALLPQDLGSFEKMFDPDDPDVGVLQFEDVTEDYVINRGVKIAGSTAAPK